MAKIICPNKQYNGISASVKFANGVGETDNPHLIGWFKGHGYTVEGEEPAQDPDGSGEGSGTGGGSNEGSGEGSELEKMTVEELKVYAEKHGIDLGRSSSQEGILKKIQEAAEKNLNKGCDDYA